MSKNYLTRFEIINCLLKFPYIHGLNRNSLEKMKRVKLEQLLKYFYIEEKGEKANKFCIFTNKCPNLSLQHTDNSTGQIVGTTTEWPLFEYPVQYLDKVNSDGEIDKNYYY